MTRAIGLAAAMAGQTFDNQSTTTSDVLIKSTYFGDADLNGSVNAADYSRIDNGFAIGETGWSNGDFNYDATINAADYSLIDTAYAFQSIVAGPLGAAIAVSPTTAIAPPLTALPPTSSSEAHPATSSNLLVIASTTIVLATKADLIE
jgi:hypothetical protein